jgi:hypothetical protein
MTPAEAAEETKRRADYAYTMIEDLTAAIGDVRMRMLSDAVTEALSA